ncbi:LysR family transcriptional regulator [Pyxidicoccus fallax]|uniref:LysR family transcriptional regulator n=1 Tax=Pyxidicoccus fallax TaxID=394095 RepID=A0A848LIR0_9BACT|nr:LysR family transcriptional regulator [Pyxidicoccus fallax]NMO17576.1 LysR family transcriptional regulator [Pyxidicoccus fallax]NPC86201.1 LysR family transcriptional regulator [Pyxidicoccus fallax]
MEMRWDDLRYLLAVARHGTLAAAARELRVDATTVGRRLDALEKSLGTRLVLRGARTLALTEGAEAVVARAREMEDALRKLHGVMSAEARAVGTVRFTATEYIGQALVAPNLGDLHARHPGLDLEMLVGSEVVNLQRGDADLALRLAPPKGDALVVRKVAEVSFALYASRGYLRRYGTPRSEDFHGHAVLAYRAGLTSGAESEELKRLTLGARRLLQSNSATVLREAAAAGLGVALLPCLSGEGDARLTRMSGGILGRRPLWLVVHKDLQKSPRVRAVSEWLVELCRRERARLTGAES